MGQQEAKKGEEDREGAEEEVEAPFTFSKGGGRKAGDFVKPSYYFFRTRGGCSEAKHPIKTEGKKNKEKKKAERKRKRKRKA